MPLPKYINHASKRKSSTDQIKRIMRPIRIYIYPNYAIKIFKKVAWIKSSGLCALPMSRTPGFCATCYGVIQRRMWHSVNSSFYFLEGKGGMRRMWHIGVNSLFITSGEKGPREIHLFSRERGPREIHIFPRGERGSREIHLLPVGKGDPEELTYFLHGRGGPEKFTYFPTRKKWPTDPRGNKWCLFFATHF